MRKWLFITMGGVLTLTVLVVAAIGALVWAVARQVTHGVARLRAMRKPH